MNFTLENRLAAPGNRRMLAWVAVAFAATGADLLNQATFQFSLLTGLFVILTYLTVEAVGGIKSMFGAAIMYLAVQGVFVATFAKFFLREPIESRLDIPETAMQIYCVGMGAMWIGALIAKQINPLHGRVLFAPLTDSVALRRLAWLAFAVECAQAVLARLRGAELASGQATNAGIVTIIVGLGFIPALAVACATGSVVIRSNRKRSLDYLVILAMLPAVLSGAVGAERTNTAVPVAAYFFAALLFGYRFKIQHYVSMALLAVFAIYILFPFGRHARLTVRGTNVVDNIYRAASVFGDVVRDPARYQTDNFKNLRSQGLSEKWLQLYQPSIEIFQRFSLIKNTDEIAYAAQKRSPLGWQTTMDGLTMATPSFFLEDKPLVGDNNMIGRLVPGMIAPKDHVMQPDTGMYADAYLSFRWWGVVFVPMVVMFLYLMIYKMIVKFDLTANVFALAVIIPLAHDFSESGISVQVRHLLPQPMIIIATFAILKGAVKVFDIKRSNPANRPGRASESAAA